MINCYQNWFLLLHKNDVRQKLGRLRPNHRPTDRIKMSRTVIWWSWTWKKENKLNNQTELWHSLSVSMPNLAPFCREMWNGTLTENLHDTLGYYFLFTFNLTYVKNGNSKFPYLRSQWTRVNTTKAFSWNEQYFLLKIWNTIYDYRLIYAHFFNKVNKLSTGKRI